MLNLFEIGRLNIYIYVYTSCHVHHTITSIANVGCRENNQELVFSDTTKLDEGLYHCEVVNIYGAIESPQVYIFVIG